MYLLYFKNRKEIKILRREEAGIFAKQTKNRYPEMENKIIIIKNGQVSLPCSQPLKWPQITSPHPDIHNLVWYNPTTYQSWSLGPIEYGTRDGMYFSD